MDQNEILVNCSFCNVEIPCPKNIRYQKHSCIDCFKKLKKNPPENINKIHVAIPKEKIEQMVPEITIQMIMQDVFPEFWKEEKKKLKEMPRKEAVEYAFATGAGSLISLMEELSEEERKFFRKSQNSK